MEIENNFSVYTEEPLEINEETTTVAEELDTEEDGSTTDTTEENSKETESTADSEAKSQAETKEGHTRFQKRIDKLVRQREDAERKASELEAELLSLKSTPKRVAKALDPLDFDSYDDYIEALSEQQPEEAKKIQAPVNTGVPSSVVRKLDDAFDDTREMYKDFDDVIKNPNVPFTNEMLEVLSELDNAGEVTYFLAKHKDEVVRISQLSMAKQAIELGKIEVKLLAKPTKRTTSAPDPIDPVVPKGDTTEKDVSKMSFKEYEAYMNKQTKSKFW